jgi:hypothetical protein
MPISFKSYRKISGKTGQAFLSGFKKNVFCINPYMDTGCIDYQRRKDRATF